MPRRSKPLAWLKDRVKTPPFSEEARIEAGTLLRRLQERESLGMPHSRPLPDLGSRCHELRIRDKNRIWRIIYRIDSDAIVIAEVADKTTQKLPQSLLETCRRRFADYDRVS